MLQNVIITQTKWYVNIRWTHKRKCTDGCTKQHTLYTLEYATFHGALKEKYIFYHNEDALNKTLLYTKGRQNLIMQTPKKKYILLYGCTKQKNKNYTVMMTECTQKKALLRTNLHPKCGKPTNSRLKMHTIFQTIKEKD